MIFKNLWRRKARTLLTVLGIAGAPLRTRREVMLGRLSAANFKMHAEKRAQKAVAPR